MKTKSEVSKEYQEGWDAHTKGQKIIDNPYQFRTVEYARWSGGFSDAVVTAFYMQLSE